MDAIPISVNFLILRGVFPGDFNTTTPKKVTPVETIYTEIPKTFTGVANWPTSSNLKCWECDQMPDSYPKFIPQYPTMNQSGDTCSVFGHFDEWSCAVRYVRREFPAMQQWDTLKILCIFESKFSGKLKNALPEAPPKTLMKAYCGSGGITLQEFKALQQL